MKKLLAAGYFGCGNLGDDAILLGFVEGVRESGHLVSVLSGAPEETYRMYGMTSYPRKDMGQVRQALMEHDALVFPGGSIFQDVTSSRSPVYYANLVREAKKQGKKVIMLGQGVGPVNGWMGKKATKFAFENSDGIAVRDPESARVLQGLGIRKPVQAAADMAFLLPGVTSEGEGYQVGQMKTIGIAPRPHGKGNEVVQLFADLCRKLFENGFMPTLIEMDRDFDGPLLQAIDKAQGGKIPSMKKISSPMELQKRLSRMDAVISMRLHGGILATTVGIPALMLSYDPKVSAFASEAGLPSALSMNSLTAARVFESFQALMKQREEIAGRIQQRRATLRQQAMANIEVLNKSVR